MFKKFLGRAIDPPSVATMDQALDVLNELGATDQSGKLTALGRHMVLLGHYCQSYRSHVRSVATSDRLTPGQGEIIEQLNRDKAY